MNVTIYHNPRCTKSRQTLELLRKKGIEPTVVEYLKTPLKAAEIRSLLAKLGLSARALLRAKEPAFKEKGLADKSLSEDALIRAMEEAPVLIERPIVLAGEKAAIGRPPENVLRLL